MTWSEIKKAVEEAGIKEDEEICSIACQKDGGDKNLHRVILGRSVKLAEGFSEEARREAAGCAA